METKKDPKRKPATVRVAEDPANAAQAAFEKIKPLIAALRPEQIAAVNLDIPSAAAIALGAYERLVELRPLIVEQLPKHSLQQLDDLPTFALGAWYAHLISLPPEDDGEKVKKLLEESTTLRDGLLVAAEALAHREIVDAKHVSEIRAGQGNLDKANDLVALANLFLQAWPKIQGKTAVELTEVNRAAALGTELLMALGARGVADRSAATPEARDVRARAFTLLDNAYSECCRAAAYLRWHEEDLASFAPPLRVRAKSSSSSDKPAPAPAPGASVGGSDGASPAQ